MSADDNILDALILGAGFSGCYQLYRLRQEGFRVALYEAGEKLGGVWYWNCYPGARVDSHVPNYEYSIEAVWRDWYWSERFPGAPELVRYFEHVDQILELSADVRFNTRVTKARFDEGEGLWHINCADGHSVRARYFLPCLGFASKAYTPDIPGLESFRGTMVHTAHWPQTGIDLTNKKVAVIGTGASGVQVIQEASKVASSTVVFQRTPMIALPMQQRTLDRAEQDEWKKGYPELMRVRNSSGGGFADIRPDSRPTTSVSDAEREAVFERAWNNGGFHFWAGTFSDITRDRQANKLAYDFWRDRTRARINDPALAEKLAPEIQPHPFGAKRPSLEQWYFDAFNQDNVALVDLNESPITEITATGIKTKDTIFDADIIVLATGFDAGTGGFTQFDLTDTDGVSMADRWVGGVDTWLGIGVAGFPNMLMLYGPQSPTAFWNGPVSAEVQGDWVVDCLLWMREKGHTRIEATEQAATNWSAHMQALGDSTLLPEADSWYMAANIPGKKRQFLFHAGVLEYMKHCNECAQNDYAGFLVS